MSTVASGSRRTRASIAAPPRTAASAADSRTRTASSAPRRATTTSSRTRSGRLETTDSSDLGNPNDALANTPRPLLPTQRYPQHGEGVSAEETDEEARDEMLVLEQVTPRPNRRILIDPPIDLGFDATQTALDRFRQRQKESERVGRASISGPPPSSNTAVGRSSLSSRSQASRRLRQSAPLPRITASEQSASHSLYTARSGISAAPTMSRRSGRPASGAVSFAETSAEESDGNTTMARPGQRLRPSLTHPDGRLDVPTIEERCAALVINAKGVLHFYMDLYSQGWRPESFDDMLRNWAPFESYKTNQLLAEAQYMHHFIDIEEVTRSLRASGQPRPDGFEEAMKMANCATFVHYIHQLPTNPAEYRRRDGQSITSQDVVRAPLRNISELSDARRIFLRWILPFNWELTDEVLNMLLDMSIQIYIHRLERIVESVRAGEIAEDVGRTAVSDHLVDLMSGDVVRHSLQRVKRQRRMTRAEIERMVQRYETFANVRQSDLQAMQYDYEAMRESFSFQSMSADLSSYVRDVVREVDVGMHSTTLPLIIDRLARESSIFSASDAPEVVPSSSSMIDSRNNDSSSVIAGPSQSTPKGYAQRTQASQPFASQYDRWLDDMLDENDTQDSSQKSISATSSKENDFDANLTASQKVQELNDMLQAPSTDEGEIVSSSSIDLNMASSPPRTSRLGARLSAALSNSGRATASKRGALMEAVELSESSEATGFVDPRRNHDGPFDSPAKQKANRLGFDSQNRLVRRTSTGNRQDQRLLDGSAAAVRESRFDSQGEEDEDVFLENAVQGGRRRKRKARRKEAAPARAAETDNVDDVAAQAAPRPRRTLRSNTTQQQALDVRRPAAGSDVDDGDENERQTARRRGASSVARQLQLKKESLSPAKRQAQKQQAERIMSEEPTVRKSTRLEARSNVNPSEEVGPSSAQVSRTRAVVPPNGDTGLGRGLPDRQSRSEARILSTASGRLVEEGEDSNEEEEHAENEHRAARSRLDGVNDELGARRATPDSQFIGDEDEAILDRRAALDAAIVAQKPRPGTLRFYRPEGNDEAVPLVGLEDPPPRDGDNIDAIAMRNGAEVAEILRSSNAVPHRRIGPYRPGSSHNRSHHEEPDPSAPSAGLSEDEVDELEDENDAAQPRTRRRRTTHAEPLGQAVRVEPYKRANLYVTGHNMTGRARWTGPEVTCLLDSLHELARYKKVAPKFKVYTEILKRHGVNGTHSRVLARWNNVQLKDKSRNELMRMKREGLRIPYWKRLLHPNIWKPPPVTVSTGRGREETEDVPAIGEDEQVPQETADQDADDPIQNDHDDEGEVDRQVSGDGNGDQVDVVTVATAVLTEQQVDPAASNPLRNEP